MATHPGEALFYENRLASLPHPTKRTLEAFRYCFFNHHSGSPFPTLGGHSTALFDDEDDLLALRDEDRDPLTAFLQDRCARIFRVSRGCAIIPQGASLTSRSLAERKTTLFTPPTDALRKL